MSNYVICKIEYVTGRAEENTPPKAQQVEAFPAVHPTLTSARNTLEDIVNTYPQNEIEFYSSDMLWVHFKWEEELAYRTYGYRHIRSRVVFWIEEEN